MLNHTVLLEESLVTMHDKLAATIQVLSNSKAENDQYRGAVTIWSTDLHMVAEHATSANQPVLHNICDKIVNKLNDLVKSTAEPITHYCKQLIHWSSDAVTYLHNKDDIQLIDKLLLPIPENEWADIAIEVNVDGNNDEDGDLDNSNSIDGSSAISTSENLQSLSLVIENAIESLVEELSESSAKESESSESLFEYCLCSISDVGFASEMIDQEFITNLCGELEQYLINKAGTPPALSQEQGLSCKLWLSDLLNYLLDLNNVTTAQKLTSFLNEQQSSELMEIYQSSNHHATDPDDKSACTVQDQSAFDTLDLDSVEQEEDNLWLESDVELDESTNTDNSAVSDILVILREELSDLSTEMSHLMVQITTQSNDSEAQETAYNQYQDLIERLADTCEELGLIGLQQVCSFIDLNLSTLQTASDNQRQLVRPLFSDWPLQALTYLEDPEDDLKCLALIECLQNQNWFNPLNDSSAHQLLADLSKEMILPDFEAEEHIRQTEALPEDIVIEIADDINPGLIDAFFLESPKFATDLSQAIGDIGAGLEIADNINAAQRFAHTLKGSANLVGVQGVANLTHHIEDILEYLLNHQDDFPLNLITTLHEAADCVETMLDALQGKDNPPNDALRILQNILDWANSIDNGNIKDFAAVFTSSIPVHKTINDPIDKDDTLTSKPTPESTHSISEESINVPTRIVDNMFRMVGEMSIMASQVQTGLQQLRKHGKDVRYQEQLVHQHRIELEDMVDIRRFAAGQRHSKNNLKLDNFDSLEMDQYDELHGSIHGFIETVVDSNEMTHMVYDQINNLENLLLTQQRLNNELQRVVMTARMIPVDTIVARLQRTVRQTCRSTGKNTELHIVGENLLLDGEVLNSLVAPIMHILRNAVDHGIETTTDRDAAGKNPVGNITLEFSRIGNNIVVRCSDDGKGLNYDRIHEIALKNNLITKTDSLKRNELARLILVSGFSTSKTVTQTSGRGVGLEVVSAMIQSQGGSMNVGDNTPCGCIISLRIPITLVTSHSILIKHYDELIAIPSNTLDRIIPPEVGEFRTHDGEITYHNHDKSYDVVTIAELLGTSGSANPVHLYDNPAILLTRTNHGITAVAVEQVVSTANLVVKGMGRYVPPLSGISGVSIMGDGNVVSIIDLQELIEEPRSINTDTLLWNENNISTEFSETPTVLVVDDSLSMRKSLSQLVEDAGYKVETARDGVEAMNMIRKHAPSLVLSDMEMPRMTGLELTSQIRSNIDFSGLPVIMITSRSAKKHRVQAEHVGVDRYITKPFSEDDLLEAVTSMITH